MGDALKSNSMDHNTKKEAWQKLLRIRKYLLRQKGVPKEAFRELWDAEMRVLKAPLSK